MPVITTATTTTMERLLHWARPADGMGPFVYQLTQGPRYHKHAYHVYCPWSADESMLLAARYDRQAKACDICTIDMNTGDVRQVAQSHNWETHTVALQQWQGSTGRIIFRSQNAQGPALVTINADGSDEKNYPITTDAVTSSPDGRWAFYVSSRNDLFPDDVLAPRDDKGLFRIDLYTGQSQLILSIQQMLDLLPNAKDLAHCHLYAKMLVSHATLDRVMFNFTNTLWDRQGGEPRVRALMTVNNDGSDPAYLGICTHHPNWHPTQNKVVANLPDCNDKLRLGIYDGHGRGLVTYVPDIKGSGHPTFSPDGKWICTDTGMPDGNSAIVVCDAVTGRSAYPTSYHAVSEGYPSFKAIDQRPAGTTVTHALQNMYATLPPAWQTHTHGTWSRDGSAYLFNADQGTEQGAQLYAIHMQQFLATL